MHLLLMHYMHFTTTAAANALLQITAAIQNLHNSNKRALGIAIGCEDHNNAELLWADPFWATFVYLPSPGDPQATNERSTLYGARSRQMTCAPLCKH